MDSNRRLLNWLVPGLGVTFLSCLLLGSVLLAADAEPDDAPDGAAGDTEVDSADPDVGDDEAGVQPDVDPDVAAKQGRDAKLAERAEPPPLKGRKGRGDEREDAGDEDAGDEDARDGKAGDGKAGRAGKSRKGRSRAARLTMPWKLMTTLTDEQKEQIVEIHVAAVDAKHAIEEQERADIEAVLTDEQLEELAAIEERRAEEQRMKRAAKSGKGGGKNKGKKAGRGRAAEPEEEGDGPAGEPGDGADDEGDAGLRSEGAANEEGAVAAAEAEIAESEPASLEYFTTDGGKTWFTDDAAKIPPWTTADGKTAYRVRVFKCGEDGEPFVNHLARYPDEVKE